jgi:hypothetical protein
LEELAEGAVKSVLRLAGLLIRSLIWLIWECLFETIAWYVGWPICRVLSFNQYPKASITEHEQAGTLTNVLVSTVGLGALIFLAYVISQLTGAG